MKGPVQKYFQVEIIQWMAHSLVSYPISDPVKAIYCNEYFDALEITHVEDQETKDRVGDMLAQGHMKAYYGAQPRLLGSKLNPNDLDEEGRKKTETILIDSVDEAQYMSVEGITFLAGKWEPETRDQVYAQLLKTARAVRGYAASKGVMVELEVFDSDMDKATLIGPAPHVARFVAGMHTTYNNFGLLVDLSHFPTTCETSRLVIRALHSYIIHLHAGNTVVKEGFKVYGDQHPGSGLLDSANDTEQFAGFFTVLRGEGFFSKDNPYVLSLEIKSWADEDEDIMLANTKRVTNGVWALVED